MQPNVAMACRLQRRVASPESKFRTTHKMPITNQPNCQRSVSLVALSRPREPSNLCGEFQTVNAIWKLFCEGFEPVLICIAQRAGTLREIRSNHVRLPLIFPSRFKLRRAPPDLSARQNSIPPNYRVEVNGLEPMTPCVQSRCSPN